MSTPLLSVVAGPNGSGKSTFVHAVLGPATGLPFINADEIAAAQWPGDEEGHAYDASRAASAVRANAITDRRSFITETVFSHPSKVALVKQATRAGYRVELHVMLIPEDVTVARVAYRVSAGGTPFRLTKSVGATTASGGWSWKPAQSCIARRSTTTHAASRFSRLPCTNAATRSARRPGPHGHLRFSPPELGARSRDADRASSVRLRHDSQSSDASRPTKDW